MWIPCSQLLCLPKSSQSKKFLKCLQNPTWPTPYLLLLHLLIFFPQTLHWSHSGPFVFFLKPDSPFQPHGLCAASSHGWTPLNPGAHKVSPSLAPGICSNITVTIECSQPGWNKTTFQTPISLSPLPYFIFSITFIIIWHCTLACLSPVFPHRM